jgi:hypothetical protein
MQIEAPTDQIMRPMGVTTRCTRQSGTNKSRRDNPGRQQYQHAIRVTIEPIRYIPIPIISTSPSIALPSSTDDPSTQRPSPASSSLAQGKLLPSGSVFFKHLDEFAVVIGFKDGRVDLIAWNDSKQTTFGKILCRLYLR